MTLMDCFFMTLTAGMFRHSRKTMDSNTMGAAMVSWLPKAPMERFGQHSPEKPSMDLKKAYLDEHGADVLVMGDDWKGKFDHFSTICEVVYFQRTPAISTSEVIEKIQMEY